MINFKVKLGIVLFLLGLLGVFSLLTMEMNIPAQLNALTEKYSEAQLRWLSLVNPTIFLFISVVVGVTLYTKVNFKVPLIESLLGKLPREGISSSIFVYGVAGGFLAGIAILSVAWIYQPFLSDQMLQLENSLKPSLLTRFLYGGITEEILIRFGIMTLLVWLIMKIFRSQKSGVYWGGILLSALIFAVGHFPIVFVMLPSPSLILLSYVLIANTVGGVVFGWLYWKKGLESAMLAHMMAHLVMVTIAFFIGTT